MVVPAPGAETRRSDDAPSRDVGTGIAVAPSLLSSPAARRRRLRRRRAGARPAPPSAAPPARPSPVKVVVTVDQWGDIVEQLGGDCTEVTTIINGGDVDPHDYEPTPADNAAVRSTPTSSCERPRLRRLGQRTRRHPLARAGRRRRRRGRRPRARATTLTSGTAPSYVQQVAAAVTTELADPRSRGRRLLRRPGRGRGRASSSPTSTRSPR